MNNLIMNSIKITKDMNKINNSIEVKINYIKNNIKKNIRIKIIKNNPISMNMKKYTNNNNETKT
jgi:hypothetical protein